MEENLDNTVYDLQQGEALGMEEYLQTISFPKDQRANTGIDSGAFVIVGVLACLN